ncbi:hypothetical protein [Streptomyces iakyrus]|uniref:hypothetical protein n=1 Tax=Streptomyces iakyrus TaxID=68219 RepID=UPI003D92ADA5
MQIHWKITIIVVAVLAIISTPLIWLLGSTDAGQLGGASVQAATGVAALLWAVLSGPQAAPVRDVARRTGPAVARGGGRSISGIFKRRVGRKSAPVTVVDSGSSTAHGQGSIAVSGSDSG